VTVNIGIDALTANMRNVNIEINKEVENCKK